MKKEIEPCMEKRSRYMSALLVSAVLAAWHLSAFTAAATLCQNLEPDFGNGCPPYEYNVAPSCPDRQNCTVNSYSEGEFDCEPQYFYTYVGTTTVIVSVDDEGNPCWVPDVPVYNYNQRVGKYKKYKCVYVDAANCTCSDRASYVRTTHAGSYPDGFMFQCIDWLSASTRVPICGIAA